MTTTTPLFHGVNLGHGYVKQSVLDVHGNELPSVVYPAMIARAQRTISGALTEIKTVEFGGHKWWTGEDALLSSTPTTIVSQARLENDTFIPVLVRGAHQRLGIPNAEAMGFCVSGLPATWALHKEKADALGKLLRDGYGGYHPVKVIPEPLGVLYSVLIDNHGEVVGDPALQTGQIGIVDLGHYTVDVAVIQRLAPLNETLKTWQIGTSPALSQVGARLNAAYERDLSLFEVDQAIRTGSIRIAGRERELPRGWDQPLIENGQAVAARLTEVWGSGANLDLILVAGGGAEVRQIVSAIEERFPQNTEVVEKPQQAIADGYARLAAKLGKKRASQA